jgi:predicted glycosyl hydrolase (DUF1957 family)
MLKEDMKIVVLDVEIFGYVVALGVVWLHAVLVLDAVISYIDLILQKVFY